MPTRRVLALAIAALALAMTGANEATTQSYPSRPITIIVPFSAGGTTDVIARILSEHMSRTLGQQFIVENVPWGRWHYWLNPCNARQTRRLHHPNGPYGNPCRLSLALSQPRL